MTEFTLVEEPAAEPVTLEEARAHLRGSELDDPALTAIIAAARSFAEEATWRAIVSQKWRAHLAGFCGGEIRLAKGRLLSVEAVKYIDPDGSEQTLDPALYTVDTAREPGRIVRAHGASWPSTRNHLYSVTVDFTAGYGEPDAVPAGLKRLLLLLIGHFHENTEAVVTGTIATELPLAIKSLLALYTLRTH